MATLIFAVVFTLVATVVLGSLFWLPIPAISYRQGATRSHQGRVTSITPLRREVLEIGLTHEAVISPELQEGPVQLIGCSLTAFIHCRPSFKPKPHMGDLIEAETQNRLYLFRTRSLDWIDALSKSLCVGRWGLFEHHNLCPRDTPESTQILELPASTTDDEPPLVPFTPHVHARGGSCFIDPRRRLC